MSARVIRDWSFNGTKALVLENGRLRVVVLPELGGKIWQITNLDNGRELLWQNPRLTAQPVPFGSLYDDMFFGGWDELFPNDIPETLQGESYPDHGELWASAWDWQVDHETADEVHLTLAVQTPISACRLTKTIRLRDGEPHMRVSWRLANESQQDLPYLWKQHVAVPVSERATLAMSAQSMYLEDFGNPRAGTGGTGYEWPYLAGSDGARHDMRATLPSRSCVSEFQYATELDGGWCSVTYADGSGLGLAFDPEVFSSCWTFASYGGWRAHEVLILEPCTGYPVSVTDGISAGTHRTLPAGKFVETEVMMAAYVGMAEVTGLAFDGSVQGMRLPTGGLA